jgi:hypothetical protein
MGYLMARNLASHRATHLEQQPPLLVWNRSKEKSEKLLRELGDRKVAIAQSVVDVATRCDIVLSSLSSDDVIRSVYKELAATLQARRAHTYPPTPIPTLTSFFFFMKPLGATPGEAQDIRGNEHGQSVATDGRHVAFRLPVAFH